MRFHMKKVQIFIWIKNIVDGSFCIDWWLKSYYHCTCNRYWFIECSQRVLGRIYDWFLSWLGLWNFELQLTMFGRGWSHANCSHKDFYRGMLVGLLSICNMLLYYLKMGTFYFLIEMLLDVSTWFMCNKIWMMNEVFIF
jgi:hypothetical protein